MIRFWTETIPAGCAGAWFGIRHRHQELQVLAPPFSGDIKLPYESHNGPSNEGISLSGWQRYAFETAYGDHAQVSIAVQWSAAAQYMAGALPTAWYQGSAAQRPR